MIRVVLKIGNDGGMKYPILKGSKDRQHHIWSLQRFYA